MHSPAAAIRESHVAAGAALTGLKTFSRRSKQLSADFLQAVAIAKPPPAHTPAAAAGAKGEEGVSKAPPLVVDGKLNYPVRKRRQPSTLTSSKAHEAEPEPAPNPSPSSTAEAPPIVETLITSEVEISAAATTAADDGSPSVVVAAVTDTKTRVRRQSARVLKRAAEAEQPGLEVKSLGASELAKSRSSRTRTARRVSRKNAGAAAVPEPQETAEMGLPAPSASILQIATAAPDYWHSSLSEKSGDAVVKGLVAEGAIPPIMAGMSTLTAAEDLAKALQHLKSADPLLKAVIEMHDAPKFEKCESCFLALTRSIVFQQLATKAAAAIFGRLVTLCEGLDNLTPTTISQLSAEQMRAIGISGRKASYLHDLAANFLSGGLSDTSILDMDDEALMTALTAVKGIGVWSVHMFMLFSLHKADVLPVSDLGIRKGLQKLYKLKELPNPAEMEKIASSWQPYRSLGSWFMWRVMSNTPIVKPSD